MSKLALIALPAGILCGAIRRAIARAASTVISWLKTRRQMRHPEPGDRLLRDVGLTGLNKHAPMLTPHHRSQTNKEC